MQSGLISVIVPVYNVEKYLKECLNSILSQTYKNLEVIMIDDGSTDKSGTICDAYAGKYKNFKVVHKENAGLGMARNTGLDNINGEFVVFIDSDDYIDSDYISNLYNAAKKTSSDFCKCGFIRITDDGDVLKTVQLKEEVFSDKEAREQLLPRMLGSLPEKKDSLEMSVWASLYATKPIIDNKLRFPSEREMISEDIVFNLHYMQHVKGACIISQKGYNYRFNQTSLSTKYREDRFDACVHFYNEMQNMLRMYNYDQIAFYRLTRMFFVYLKMCISQEKNHRDLSWKKTLKMNYNAIKRICVNDVVKKAINNYPIEKLGFPQRVFIELIKHRCSWFLLIMMKMNVI